MQKNYPIASERLAQCDDDIFVAAQDIVNLAVAVLSMHDVDTALDATVLAVQALRNYADWRNIELPAEICTVLRNRDEEDGAIQGNAQAKD
jgi:hypothetical protein